MKNRLLLLLLGLLGFAGCRSDEPEPDMYGTPSARFTIKGRVGDSHGTPIPGIRVTPVDPAEVRPVVAGHPGNRPEAFTSGTGEYEVSGSCFDRQEFFITLRMEDVDGEENGLFDPKETDVAITQADRVGSDGWTSDYRKQAGDTHLTESER